MGFLNFGAGDNNGGHGNGVGGWVENWNDSDLFHPGRWFQDQGQQQQQAQQTQLANANAANAAAFTGQTQADYARNQAGLNSTINGLRAQAAGRNSVSAEQLRQGLSQNLSNQQSMAAGAAPNNAAMASRNAAMNMGRAGYGLAGQQAVAGLQERNQAQQALGQLQLGQSGQNLQGTLGGYGAVNQGLGMGNSSLDARARDQASQNGMLGGLIGGIAASDRELKSDIEDGTDDADHALALLRAYSFRYKDEKHGEGHQLGVMAQDLEDAGLGHVVIDTPAGKMIHGARAATTALALIASLVRRIEKLEGQK